MKTSYSNIDCKTNYINDYIIKETIGTGTFCEVKLGINKYTNEKVAIKLLEKSKIIEKNDLERIQREISIIKNLNHPNIVKINEIFENENYYFLIMDYCSKGELFDYIVNKIRLNEEETSFFFYQIINAIEYIHSKGIVHRDLKPENLLLCEKNKLKIIDFGLSNYYNNNKLLITPCGSPCYAAPEMVSGKKYNGFKTDIWAIGITLFAMLCGYLPFEDTDNDVLFKKILDCKIEFPDYLSHLSKDIINKILNVQPEKRYCINDIKCHQFYLNGKKIYENVFGCDVDLKKEEKKFRRKISAENLINLRNKNKIEITELFDLGNKLKNKKIFKKSENVSNTSEEKNNKLFTDFSNIKNKLEKIPKITLNSKINDKKDFKGNIKLHKLFSRNKNKDIIQKYYSNIEKENRKISEGKNMKNLKIIEKDKLSSYFKLSLLNKDRKKVYLKSEKKNNNRNNKNELQSSNSNNFYINPNFPLSNLPVIYQENNIKTSKKISLKTESELSEHLKNFQINSTRLNDIHNKIKKPFNFSTHKFINLSKKEIK